MRKIFATIISIAIILTAFADNVSAGCCAVPHIEKSHQVTDRLINAEAVKTRNNTLLQATRIRDKIEEVGQALQQETRAQTSSTTQMFEAQNQLLKDLFEAAGLAREKSIIDRQYGDKSMPPAGCESVDLGASMRSGGQVRQKIKAGTVEKAVAHANRFSRAVDAKKELQTMVDEAPAADQLANAMFGSVVEKEDQKAVLESVIYLSDPSPPRPLSDHEKTKPQATQYESERELRNRHMAIVQQVLADHVSRRIPSMPLGAWASEQWQSMGGTGEPAGVVDGYMSATSVVDMLVDSRIGNPNWSSTTVPSLNDTGLKREQLYMDAARLYIEREQMRMMEQLLVLNALNMAGRLNSETDAKLRQMQINMEQ
ncbi:MAG: hypothetical protein PVH87_25835 [Desulfobacteraceae bacterium]|jgi:hypothetical protein